MPAPHWESQGARADWKLQGYYTKDRENKNLDVTVVEASEILEDGSVILGASIGATPELVQMADKVCFSPGQE